jgi:hypothetical protein
VDQLESLLTALQKNNQQQTAVSEWEKDDPSAVVTSDGMPTSCRDLRILGHLWSGIYSVMGNHSVETVYCDFTKVLDDPGIIYQLRSHENFKINPAYCKSIVNQVSKNGLATPTSNQHALIFTSRERLISKSSTLRFRLR